MNMEVVHYVNSRTDLIVDRLHDHFMYNLVCFLYLRYVENKISALCDISKWDTLRTNFEF